MERAAIRKRMHARELEEEDGQDLPDSFTFLALDAFGALVASSLIVLGLRKLEELIVGAIW
jgi:hypothetical protein